MSQLKRWHCSQCGNEWDGYCPICAECREIAWEMPDCDRPGYKWEDD